MRPGRPVVFVHGLWKASAIWDPWLVRFQQEGYRTSAPRWPGERGSAAETRAHAREVGDLSFDGLVDHFAREIASLDEAPICVGHSFGALVAERLLASGTAVAAVGIDPAQHRSALPGSIEILRNDTIVPGPDPASSVVTLPPRQFRAAFTDGAGDAQAAAFYDRYAIPAPAEPLLEVAGPGFRLIPAARTQHAGPLLLIPSSRPTDAAVAPSDPSIATFRDSISVEVNSAFGGYGHSLVFDDRWEVVADVVLDWLERKGLTH